MTTIITAAALLLAGCATPEPTTRERLEAQGVVYSDEDWDRTVRRLCLSKYPDIYMGIDGAVEKHRDVMTEREKVDAVLAGGTAPNASNLTRRERQMVLDMVLDSECKDE